MNNTEAAIIGINRSISIKPSVHSSQLNLIETTRSFLSILLMVMIFRSLFASGRKGALGGRGGRMDIFENSKSKRFRQAVNVKFADVMGMQKAK